MILCGFARMGKNEKFDEKGSFLLPNEALYQAEPRPDVCAMTNTYARLLREGKRISIFTDFRPIPRPRGALGGCRDGGVVAISLCLLNCIHGISGVMTGCMNSPLFALSMPGWPEIVFILVIVLLLFGAKKLPELARGIGQSLGEFKRARDEFEREIHKSTAELEIKEPAEKQPHKPA